MLVSYREEHFMDLLQASQSGSPSMPNLEYFQLVLKILDK